MDQRTLCLQYYMHYYHYYMWRRILLAAIIVCLGMYWYKINVRKRKRKSITYAPMFERDVERMSRLNRMYYGTEANCISEPRMRKFVFHKLCANLRRRGLLVDTFHVTVDSSMLWVITEKNRSIGFEFYRSGETVSRYFNAVLDALCLLARDVICIRTIKTHSKITSSSRFHPYFEVHPKLFTSICNVFIGSIQSV